MRRVIHSRRETTIDRKSSGQNCENVGRETLSQNKQNDSSFKLIEYKSICANQDGLRDCPAGAEAVLQHRFLMGGKPSVVDVIAIKRYDDDTNDRRSWSLSKSAGLKRRVDRRSGTD